MTAAAASVASGERVGGRSILTGISAYLAKSMPEVCASPNCVRGRVGGSVSVRTAPRRTALGLGLGLGVGLGLGLGLRLAELR